MPRDARSERSAGPPGGRPVAWWLRFLAGFVVLYGVLAGLAEIDATGRFGLPILAGVLLVAVVVERVLYGSPGVAAAARVRAGRRRAPSLVALAVSVPVCWCCRRR